MVDTHALGACAARFGGSSPLIPTRTDLRALQVQETPVDWANLGVGIVYSGLDHKTQGLRASR